MPAFASYATSTPIVPPGVEADENGKHLEKRLLIQGHAGYYNQAVHCPPGWVIPPHSHDHDELFVVLEGSCTVDGGDELVPFDSAAFPAGTVYAIEAGAQGLTFMVVRSGPVETVVR